MALETQRPPAPTASRSGAACGAMPRRKTLPPLALTAVTPRAVLVGDPDAVAAVGDRRRGGRRRRSVRSTSAAGGVDPQQLALARLGDPDRAAADGDPGEAAAERAPACADRLAGASGRAGSGCRRLRSSPRPAEPPAATRSGGVPTAIGAETSTPPPPPEDQDDAATAAATSGRRRRGRSRAAAPRGRRAVARACGAGRGRCAAQRSRSSPPSHSAESTCGRPHAPSPGAGGRRRSAPRRCGSGRRGPWRRRARSPRSSPSGISGSVSASRARVGRDPGHRLEEDAAERVDVGRRADAAAAPLLRRHVLGGADHRGAAGRAGLVERLGQAEVGEEGAVAFDQDVVRLDVAVDDAGGVGGVERVGDLAEQRRSPAPAAAAPRGRSAAAGRPPRPAASRPAARRRPRASRRSAPPPGGRGGRRAATRAGSARGSRRGRRARGRSPSAPPAVRGRGGWRGRRRPCRRGRSARRPGSRRRWSRPGACGHPGVIPPDARPCTARPSPASRPASAWWGTGCQSMTGPISVPPSARS